MSRRFNRTKWMAGLLGGTLLTIAVPASFGQARPDLVGVTQTFDSPLPAPNVNSVDVDAICGNSGVTHYFRAYGRRYVYLGPNSLGTLKFFLYEPDKVTRKTDQVKFEQNGYVNLVELTFSTAGGNVFFRSDQLLAPSCKAKAQVKGSAAKWQLSCGTDTFDTLGLDAGQRAAFAKIFGSGFRVRGQTP